MIRMIGSSFYNTLIDEEGAIPTSTMFLLDSYKKKGSFFSVITNRGFEEVLYYNESFPFIDYILAYNGSVIYDVNHQVILYKKALSKKVIEEVKEAYKNYPISYYSNIGKTDYETEDIYKIEVKISKKECKSIKKISSCHISILKIENELYLEISPNTNYEAFRYLIEKLKISSNNILLVIGNESDEDLLKYLNTYVVSNAPISLKRRAKNKTKSNTSKGFENVLKKWKN
ncbi:MAG: HAD family phosphatase [Bacilli bacterium]|nr:HAD family phosphatase [Bacilli bacterium]